VPFTPAADAVAAPFAASLAARFSLALRAFSAALAACCGDDSYTNITAGWRSGGGMA